MSDDLVVAAAKDGDPDAWRELYRAHAGRLVVWLATRASSDSAISAEDVAAETWLTAAAKIKTFSGSSHDFGGWLFGIGRKLAANTRRRDGRRRTDAVAEVPDAVGVEGIEHLVAGQDRVRALLAELRPARARRARLSGGRRARRRSDLAGSGHDTGSGARRAPPCPAPAPPAVHRRRGGDGYAVARPADAGQLATPACLAPHC